MNRRESPRCGAANVCAPSTEEHRTSTGDIARLLARLLAPYVAAELRSGAAGDWCDQTSSPLGRRRHRELAKSGAFPAFKDGRRWRARRADVDAYIESQRPAAPLEALRRVAAAGAPSANDATDPDEPAVRAALAEVGLELVALPSRPRRNRR